jgi:hypothetical protein
VSGIAAAMSMAASQYLSSKSEETAKNPVTASLYTGNAYLATVLILELPFLLLEADQSAGGRRLVRRARGRGSGATRSASSCPSTALGARRLPFCSGQER